MPNTSERLLVECLTPGCTNKSYSPICPGCQAREAGEQAQVVVVNERTCTHAISVTGDFPMVQRLLPDYKGGEPQPGYMLDVCKECLKELPERPYNPVRAMGRHTARVH